MNASLADATGYDIQRCTPSPTIVSRKYEVTMNRLHLLLAVGFVNLMSLWLTAEAQNEWPQLEHRWVYLTANFQGTDQPDKAIAIARRAKAAGYNGIMLVDYKFHVLEGVVERYFENLAKFKEEVERLGLEIIPAVAPFGYSSGILAHNPNLAEAIPVVDLPMRVDGNEAKIVQRQEPFLGGGDFEVARGDRSRGWDFQDEPGKASFVDPRIFHEGKQSLRFENLGQTNAPSGNGRISKKIKVSPWRQMHASVWIKTKDFQASEVRLNAIDGTGRSLVHSNLGVRPNQDWTLHHAVFNTLNNTEFQFYCGTWGGKTGTLWMDDVQLEEIAFMNLVRRDDCPLEVRDEQGVVYREGIDFEPIVDKHLGVQPWRGEFTVFHDAPKLQLTANSKIRPETNLLVSYNHTVTVHDGQVACSLDHPEVFRILEKQIRGVDQLLKPQRYMLSHDEIRVANWLGLGRTGENTAGALLAQNMRQTAGLVGRINPQAKLCVWSDMFDPFHNAVKGPYYLVNGTYEGSWEGLPPGITIVNWNSGKAKESLTFFDQLGYPQILAGYYDHDPKQIKKWLEQARGIKSVKGVMYTTWRDNYDDLETFAKAWSQR